MKRQNEEMKEKLDAEKKLADELSRNLAARKAEQAEKRADYAKKRKAKQEALEAAQKKLKLQQDTRQ